jgi:hypothetical protein
MPKVQRTREDHMMTREDWAMLGAGIAVCCAFLTMILMFVALHKSRRESFARSVIPSNQRPTEHLDLTPNEVRLVILALARFKRNALVFAPDQTVLSELHQKLIQLKSPT